MLVLLTFNNNIYQMAHKIWNFTQHVVSLDTHTALKWLKSLAVGFSFLDNIHLNPEQIYTYRMCYPGFIFWTAKGNAEDREGNKGETK